MSSLSAGKHTVKVNFTDGSAETTLTVAQKDTKDTGKTDAGKKPASKSAKTGDNSNLIAWFILLAASVCIFLCYCQSCLCGTICEVHLNSMLSC